MHWVRSMSWKKRRKNGKPKCSWMKAIWKLDEMSWTRHNFYVKPLIIKSNIHFFFIYYKRSAFGSPINWLLRKSFVRQRLSNKSRTSSVESCSTVKCFFSSVLIGIVSKSSNGGGSGSSNVAHTPIVAAHAHADGIIVVQESPYRL